jgi:SAM-dependent methyltransferase
MKEPYREDLAYIHNAGFGQFAHEAAELLLAELAAARFYRGLVIDLGCGGGILSERIAAAGFDVLGVDISAAQIDLAGQRVPSGRFVCGSLLTAELPPCVAVAAIGECFNYLFDERHSVAAVRETLARVFAALTPGGLLIFDIAEPGRVPGGTSKSFIETDDWAVLVAAEETSDGLLTRHIASFRKLGDLYRRDHETHRQRLLPRAVVESWLHEIGFETQRLDTYGGKPFFNGHAGFLARKRS